MVFPGHTHLHFGHSFVYYNENKSVLLCKLLNCLSVHTNIELSQNNFCYSRSIVGYVKFRKPMTSNLQAGLHFRVALEHMHLIGMHFVLHKLQIAERTQLG